MICARGGRMILSGLPFALLPALCLLVGLVVPESTGYAAGTSVTTTYYVDSSAPCPGAGTAAAPWCDFRVVNSKVLKPGDQVLLKSGDTFATPLILRGSGTSSRYVQVGSYGSGPMPVLQGNNERGSVGINIYQSSYVEIENLAIEDAAAGVLINDAKSSTGFRFMHLHLSGDVNGIQAPSSFPAGTVSNVLVQDVEATDNRLGCKINACAGFALALGSVSDVIVNRLFSFGNCGATEWSLGAGASNVLIENSKSTGDAGCAELGGETANFIDNDTNITFVNDIVTNAVFNRTGVDFSAIDLEPADGPDREIKIEDNYIAHNAGPGIQLLDHPAAISNVEISGNVLVDNGAHWSPVAYPVLGQIWTDEWLPGYVQSTGSIADNLYYAPPETGGFEQVHAQANYSGFTQSDNVDLGDPGKVWYAADGFNCSTQGANRWSYQSKAGNSTWTNLSGCTTVDTLDQEWTTGGTTNGFVSNFEEMPPSTPSAWVARSWKALTSGPVNIRGRILMSSPACPSSVTAEITKNNTPKPIWGPRVIHAGNQIGIATDLNGVRVNAGDALHFAVQEDGSSQCRVSWTPSVSS
jgi:hypothetical protein